MLGGFVGIADAGEFGDEALARLLVETLAVVRLADFERGGDVDLDEGAVFGDEFAHGTAGGGVGRDGGAVGGRRAGLAPVGVSRNPRRR